MNDTTGATGTGAAGAHAGDDVAHPGPASAVLPRVLAAAIVEQARAEYPNESCGVVVGDGDPAAGGSAVRYEPCRNAAASPYRYTVHPDDAFRVLVEIDDSDAAVWGIAHSHVRSPAIPSPTDIGLAQFPDALYLLVSLSPDEADPASGEPSLRAWRIVEGAVHEVRLVIE